MRAERETGIVGTEAQFIWHGIDRDMMLTYIGGEDLSTRGVEWLMFAAAVMHHIENYTVPQYGDKGEDQATEWDMTALVEQAKKYLNRHGKNQREGQELLDLKKAAHYIQMAFQKFIDDQSAAGFEEGAGNAAG